MCPTPEVASTCATDFEAIQPAGAPKVSGRLGHVGLRFAVERPQMSNYSQGTVLRIRDATAVLVLGMIGYEPLLGAPSLKGCAAQPARATVDLRHPRVL